MSEMRLAAELALSRHVRVAFSQPLRVFDTSIRYLDGSGAEVELTGPNIHHRNETLVGPGDPWLLGVWSMVNDTWMFAARAGASLPLGHTEPDPFELGDMGLAHEHFQFGTGTFDPLLGVDVVRRMGQLRLSAFALTKQTLYENPHGYQAGDRYVAGLAGESALGTKAWSFRLGAELQHERAETWHGTERKDEGNLGRTDVLLAAGVRWLHQGFSVDASVRVPVYQHVIGGQIDIPVVLELGGAWAFDAWGGGGDDAEHEHDEHAHHHHEDDEATHADADTGPVAAVEDPELDILEYVKDGSAPDLAPVAGKLTLFDFWAPWCKPCKLLSHELRELSRRHPGQFAVRMINVVDWDSPAATRWLTPGNFSLPHVKIFDASGQLVYERSASPAVILQDVESRLAP